MRFVCSSETCERDLARKSAMHAATSTAPATASSIASRPVPRGRSPAARRGFDGRRTVATLPEPRLPHHAERRHAETPEEALPRGQGSVPPIEAPKRTEGVEDDEGQVL